MSCRPLRWLWGLIPLALIGLMVNYFVRPVIEADLKKQGEIALKESGLPWASMSFEGRDGVLSGIAFDDGARAKAIKIVQSTYGVRIVDDRASLVDQVDNFYWMATRKDGRVRLKGFVPNDEMHRTLIGMASASFPGLEIDDRMKIARGAPSVDAWLSGVSFAFKQLGQMNNGRAQLDGTDFSIFGEARDVAAYNLVDGALSGDMPRGIVLKARNIVSPAVSPFTWAAAIQKRQLVLSGYAPNADLRDRVVADAKAKFPDLKIVNQLVIASGAPAGWIGGTSVALAALKKLGNGRAIMTDASLNISGATKNNVLPADIRNFIEAGLPSTFKNNVDIAVLATQPAKLDWHAVLSKPSVVLEGDVPDRATKNLILERARTNFPGRRVVNQMNIKSVSPPQGWSLTALRALDAMTRLSEGEATLNDTRLRVSGTATTVNAIETIRETVTSYLPNGYQGYENVKPPSPTFSRYNYTEYEEEGDNWWRSFLANAKKKIVKPIVNVNKPIVDVKKPIVDVKEILASKKPVSANVCGNALNEVARSGIVRFETNSSRINSASYPTLDKLFNIANKCPNASFEISGHTDSDGSKGYNKKLSLKRAASIVSYLKGKGIDGSRMKSAGYGESRPIAPNDTAANKARNRRIEFKVLSS